MDERLTPAVLRMRAAFLEDFETVRTEAFACVADPARCTISSAQWYQRATVGIDAIAGVSAAAFERAHDGIAATREDATRALVFSVATAAVALVLLFGAGSFIRRRILLRLEELKDAALRVAGGGAPAGAGRARVRREGRAALAADQGCSLPAGRPPAAKAAATAGAC